VKTLLPPGCYDVLPPFARQESQLSQVLLDVFASYGYAQLAPPLLEYSDNLLAGRGAKLSSQMFRVMDASAGRVMAIRPDITLQVSRIASNLLKNEPRPLRLCYNGLILRLQGEQLKNDRQLRQAGIELIGAGSPEADAEVITIAGRALAKAGITTFTLDVNLPSIVAALVATDALTPDEVTALYAALAHKDATSIEKMQLTYKDSLIGLMQYTGDASAALRAIEKLDLPTAARELCNNLRDVVLQIEAQKELGCTITVDATESQGYAYHSGVGFTIYVPGVAYEVGRGGRYRVEGEEATGFTLYVETLRSLLKAPAKQEKILVAHSTSKAECESLQAKGYVTIYALPDGDAKQQAKKLGCTQIFEKGQLTQI
jgi:ATP phosphoribosyltransferase regulatory subunit